MSITPYHRNRPQGWDLPDLTAQDRKRNRYAEAAQNVQTLRSPEPDLHPDSNNPRHARPVVELHPRASTDRPLKHEVSRAGRTPEPVPLNRTESPALRADPRRPGARAQSGARSSPSAPPASSLTLSRSLAMLAARGVQIALFLAAIPIVISGLLALFGSH